MDTATRKAYDILPLKIGCKRDCGDIPRVLLSNAFTLNVWMMYKSRVLPQC